MGMLSLGEVASRPEESVDGARHAAAGDVSRLGELLAALGRLDRRLALAVEATRSAHPADASDAYRGLYIDPAELDQLLARGHDAAPAASEEGQSREPLCGAAGLYPARLARLGREFGLSTFDLDLLLIALAPELDLRYERVYAYLQDDVTRKRPSVDLALNLLCASAPERLARRAHFGPAAPLARAGLLELVPDPNQFRPPLLAHYLKAEDQVVSFLLGEKGPDARLAPFCRRIEPAASWDDLPVAAATADALRTSLARARAAGRPLRLYLHGPRGAGRRLAAEALAGTAGARLLVADLEQALASAIGFEQAVRLIFLDARLHEDALCLEGFDALRGEANGAARRCLADALGGAKGLTVIAGGHARAVGLEGVLAVHVPAQDFRQRRAIWEESLNRRGARLAPEDLDALAGRFRLTHGEIVAAAASAADRARWLAAARPGDEAGDEAPPSLADLFASAREQSGGNLSDLARAIEPRHGWGDIVLPPDQLSQLREICGQAARRHVVYGRWGFGRKLSLGKGLNALFSGPPGTGKTMAAEVIASDLRLGLYKIDLSQVVSKYIGETEKNLAHVFREAQSSSSILFFDEADALFGKRSEVKDAHDRYANIEIGYLLQRMEEFDGVAILATNLRHHLDEAFVRRMHFIVEFPFPDEEHRRRIWEVTFPAEAPLGPDVDFGLLARDIKLAGGQIKNIAVAAAFYAASDGGPVQMSHLMRATRREHQKLGRTWEEKAADAHVTGA
jgi:hypothetical protein